MNIFTRIKNLFSKAVSAGVASLSSMGIVQWFTRDYENFAKEAYIQNFIAYRCIDLIAQSVASVPWSVFKRTVTDGKEGREEIADHPLNRILKRANPNEGWAAFQVAVVSYLNIAGQSFIERIGPETGRNKGIPFELQHHRPDQIKPILGEEKELIGWALVIDGQIKKEWEIDPITGESDLLQIKRFHPLSDIEGLSPIEPAAKSIDTSNEALTWNKKLLENEARPGMLLIFDGALGDDQFNRLRKQFRERHQGSGNTGEAMIVEGQMKDAKPFTLSPKEMDFLDGNWDLARQVCTAYGVPPMLVGIPGESTYNNFNEAREYLWDGPIFFFLTLLHDEYNNWFFPENDETFIDYMLDDVPALANRRQQKWEMIEKSTILTINEKREELGKEEIDGGDVLFVPANVVPLETAAVTEEEIDDSEQDVVDEVDDEMNVILFEEKKKN